MSDNVFQAAFLAPRDSVDYVYGPDRFKAISERTSLLAPCPIVDDERIAKLGVEATDVDVLFSTWGLPVVTGAQLDRHFPNLKALFHAAGTVGYFAQPYLERGITIVSAWRANAVSVAQFTVAQMVLAMKGYFRNVDAYDGSECSYRNAFRGRGAYGETVAILGAGAIGSRVIELLKPYDVNILVWDPFLDAGEAAVLGVEKVATPGEAFARGCVVSNHLANKPETMGLISRKLLASMRPDAVFINTGRGPTVDEGALIELLEARPDLTALLDVTDPEPTGIDSRLLRLRNARVTTHIAGTIGDEVHRMADLCIDEFDRFAGGQPLRHQVTKELLATMA